MKLAISNLAWDHPEDAEVLQLLKKYNISAIEVAVSKISGSIKKYRQFWNKNNIKIVATTSLLFGHPELQVFGNQGIRDETLKYLSTMIEAASQLGAKAMVFGSPKNRITNGLDADKVTQIAIDFFYKIGEVAKKYDIYFGIEANPSIYGTDFINTTDEAIELVKKVNHPNFGVHLDTNTMTVNKEDYLDTISKALSYSHHYHISEPYLKPIPTDETDHPKVASAITKSGYKDWVSIEMPLGPDINHLEQIEKTLEFVTSVY